MKSFVLSLTSLGLLLFVAQSRSQTYSVPWAQQQPAWVFPNWFEDATGSRDTLYFNYDPSADTIFNQIRDTVFGDFRVPFDTSRFQVYEDCVFQDDLLVYKSATYSATTIYYGTNLCFWKVVLPVTVSWDVDLFRSSELPFPDQSPAPRAQGLYQPASLEPISATQDCFMTEPVLMTDSFLVPSACHFADSFVLDGSVVMPMSLQIQPWTGYLTSIVETQSNLQVTVFPNPATNSIKLDGDIGLKSGTQLLIINSLGQTFYEAHWQSRSLTVNVGNWPNGVYQVVVKNSRTYFSSTFIVVD